MTRVLTGATGVRLGDARVAMFSIHRTHSALSAAEALRGIAFLDPGVRAYVFTFG